MLCLFVLFFFVFGGVWLLFGVCSCLFVVVRSCWSLLFGVCRCLLMIVMCHVCCVMFVVCRVFFVGCPCLLFV